MGALSYICCISADYGTLDLLWVVYFLFAGRSIFNLETRRKHGKEYIKLLPHLVGWVFVIAFFVINFKFVDRSFYDF